MSVLVAVTDHAAERFRQRIGGRLGDVDPRLEIIGRVTRAWDAGRTSTEPPSTGSAAARAPRGAVYVRDLVDRSLLFVCRHDHRAGEVIVVTLWEQDGGPAPPRVPRTYTDALRKASGRRPPRP